MKLKLILYGVAALVYLQSSNDMRAQDISPIVTEGVINAPIDSVWAAWTTGEGLRSWLAPHAEIDLRIGGLMRTNYQAKEKLGDPGTIENTILSFEPKRMLSFKVSKQPIGFPFPNEIFKMWTVIYLEPTESEQTHMRAVSLGFQATEQSEKMRAFFERGNNITLQELQRRFPGVSR